MAKKQFSLEQSLTKLRQIEVLMGAGVVSDLATLAGKYLSKRDHSVASFSFSGGSLVVLGANLRGIGPNQFEGPDGAILTFSSSDGMMKVTVEVGGEIVFAGDRIEAVHVGDAVLAAYAGTYTSTELDATYKLSVENGSLMLRANWNRPVKLNPIVRDEFQGGSFGNLVFHRDANNRISGLSVFAGRIRNVTFEKTN